MKRIIIILISILCAVLLSSCNYFENRITASDSDVDKALEALLTRDNYKSEVFSEQSIINNGDAEESEGTYESVIFHYPYKCRSFSLAGSNDKGVVSSTVYEIEKGGHVEKKITYQLEDGKEKEFDTITQPVYQEFFVRQMKNHIVSEELIEDSDEDGDDIRKYKVVVTGYPFIGLFGISADKRESETIFFIDEFKTCEVYVYTDAKTNDIKRIEYDISEKKDLPQKINDRMKKEKGKDLGMFEFEKIKVSIKISNINDNSPEIAEIRKEIDNVMK